MKTFALSALVASLVSAKDSNGRAMIGTNIGGW